MNQLREEFLESLIENIKWSNDFKKMIKERDIKKMNEERLTKIIIELELLIKRLQKIIDKGL